MLNAVSGGLQLVAERALAPAGVTSAQWRVLATLAAGGDLRVSDLAITLELDQAATSRLVARLESQRLLERHPHPEDGRSTIVRLSEQGQQTFAQASALLAPLLPKVIEGFDPQQLSALMALLTKLEANLSRLLSQSVE